MRRRISAIAMACIVFTLVPAVDASATPGFVTRNGTTLMLEGEPFRFTGLNLYNANSDGWCGPEMRSGNKLDDALSGMGPGKEVLRAWFFQPLAIAWPNWPNPEGAYRDWSAFDRTLAIADAHGMKVIVTLTDHWGECGTRALDAPESGPKTAYWYEQGYTEVQAGNLVSYRDWVAEISTRYRDDPRIAFWQLINEAEVAPCPPGDLTPFQTLRDWAADVSGLIKSIDPNHLVSLGTIGSGQCGADGPRYKDVHSVPTIDVCEYHDYGAPSMGIPGDQFNGLQLRIDQCNELGKPLFVGEAGIIPNDVGGSLEQRADAFQTKVEAQFVAGVRGFLAWAWSPVHPPVSTLDNYDVGPGDPALDALIGPRAFQEYAPPVDLPPAMNSVKAGAAVPVKFSLDGDKGLDIFASGSPIVQPITCASAVSVDPVEQIVQARTSSLSYDPTTDLYNYVWKTDKAWAGKCMRLLLLFADGSYQQGLFQFTR